MDVASLSTIKSRRRRPRTGTSFGLRIPALIVTDYLVDPDVVAQRVADILERHWDDEPVVRLDDAARFLTSRFPTASFKRGACS